ncbi:unnamed protein product [Caenorhabditis bovis]|uniref:Uncharacterized protein n=1 Tax=Caenorhabditis bovis TaxID=2654633 RepID=A0A8S1ET03_9PELO|nr:unnamed protein product [Caenorhabditis bovis]
MAFRDNPSTTSNFSQNLYFYSILVNSISTIVHYCTDGFFSISLLSSIVFATVLHYKSTSSSLQDINLSLRRQHLSTTSRIFSTTLLAAIRVAFISIKEESSPSLYLAYLSLFIAFSDNLQLLTDAESYGMSTSAGGTSELQPHRPQRTVRYAPAG